MLQHDVAGGISDDEFVLDQLTTEPNHLMRKVNPHACVIIRDEGTTSIVRAFTREGARGKGIATALLDRSLEWARAEGYERCAVDFEPMNYLAARFWMRHFQPVIYALVRQIDDRIVKSLALP